LQPKYGVHFSSFPFVLHPCIDHIVIFIIKSFTFYELSCSLTHPS
jgi:hypothetical protein